MTTPVATHTPTIPLPLPPGGAYYILIAGRGELRFALAAQAQPIYIPGFELDLFLHCGLGPGRGWAVSEGVSGCYIGGVGWDSRRAALTEARLYLRGKSAEQIAAHIAISVANYGMSPRYATKKEGAE